MMKLILVIFLVLCSGTSCILRPQTANKKFITLHHDLRQRMHGLLINKVHAPFWTIHYNFDKCPPVDKETQEKFTQIMTKFIQSWLQPLREYTARPIVNNFRYKLSADWAAADFGITHICEVGSAFAFFAPLGIKNYVREFVLEWRWIISIVHELGHLFGLADTYIRAADRGKPGLDTGALDMTRGSQPVSHMVSPSMIILLGEHRGVRGIDDPIPVQGLVRLSQDDINGIIWLYKFTYEGLQLENCFFPNYELEESPFGCVPKYTLIFELKHGHEYYALQILAEDEDLDVNEQDADGLTALHHAVLNQFEAVIKKLLAHPDIKPSLKNKEGLTPLQLARALKLERIARLIAAHPQIMPVEARDKQITSWGELKKER